jgi:hypothetical protein
MKKGKAPAKPGAFSCMHNYKNGEREVCDLGSMVVTRMGYGHILRYEIGWSRLHEEYGIHGAGRVADATAHAVLFAHKENCVLFRDGVEHTALQAGPAKEHSCLQYVHSMQHIIEFP